MFNKLVFAACITFVLTACVTVNGRPPQNEKASAINVQLGMGYMQQNNLNQANEKLLKALRQDPESAAAHNAYAILQDRLLQKEVAELHYRKATTLDPKDSQAANNFGTFLCRNNREAESEAYFLQALKNPLYKTPEYAYTNAAICLIRIGEKVRAKDYLSKALAARSDFATALLAMSDLHFEEQKYDLTKIYIDRFHRVTKPTARSLWLSIRTDLELDANGNVEALVKILESDYPDSKEYQSWLKLR
jgi:type IV pilus assembly protein PilF